jgi:acyl-CoA reductase-like NAD-dependent aldehyde dehydrogenase
VHQVDDKLLLGGTRNSPSSSRTIQMISASKAGAARGETSSIGINSVIHTGAAFGGVNGSGIGRELCADSLDQQPACEVDLP